MGYITPKHTAGTLVNLALNPPILLWASHRYFLIAPAHNKTIAVSQPPCHGKKGGLKKSFSITFIPSI
jgi:hypothetical protein